MSCNPLAEPNTSYADMNITYDVELPNTDSTETGELICDIQPGALRQRYSVVWIDSNSFFGDTFNITVNVSYSLFDKLYQCIVTVDHNGQGITRTYEGRYITIHSTIPDGRNITIHSTIPDGRNMYTLIHFLTFPILFRSFRTFSICCVSNNICNRCIHILLYLLPRWLLVVLYTQR